MEYFFVVCDTDGMVCAAIVEKRFFRQNGGIDDRHISVSNGGNMPDILGWDEETESYFLPWNQAITTIEAHGDLVSKGLKFDLAFADNCEQALGGTIYRPEN